MSEEEFFELLDQIFRKPTEFPWAVVYPLKRKRAYKTTQYYMVTPEGTFECEPDIVNAVTVWIEGKRLGFWSVANETPLINVAYRITKQKIEEYFVLPNNFINMRFRTDVPTALEVFQKKPEMRNMAKLVADAYNIDPPIPLPRLVYAYISEDSASVIGVLYASLKVLKLMQKVPWDLIY